MATMIDTVWLLFKPIVLLTLLNVLQFFPCEKMSSTKLEQKHLDFLQAASKSLTELQLKYLVEHKDFYCGRGVDVI